jgi:hypothetical protein
MKIILFIILLFILIYIVDSRNENFRWSKNGNRCVHNKRADNPEDVLVQCKNILRKMEEGKLTWGDLIEPYYWTYRDNPNEASSVMKDVDNCNSGNKINIYSNKLLSRDIKQNMKYNCPKKILNGNDIKFNVDHTYHYGELILE